MGSGGSAGMVGMVGVRLIRRASGFCERSILRFVCGEKSPMGEAACRQRVWYDRLEKRAMDSFGVGSKRWCQARRFNSSSRRMVGSNELTGALLRMESGKT